MFNLELVEYSMHDEGARYIHHTSHAFVSRALIKHTMFNQFEVTRVENFDHTLVFRLLTDIERLAVNQTTAALFIRNRQTFSNIEFIKLY